MTNEIVIDRLTGRPFGVEDGMEPIKFSFEQQWTVETLAEAAKETGKVFSINPEVNERLASDLTKGALVLFDSWDVEEAIQRGLVKPEKREDLLNTVIKANDIAVYYEPVPDPTLNACVYGGPALYGH